MTGWRLGWVVIPENAQERFTKLSPESSDLTELHCPERGTGCILYGGYGDS